MLPCIRIMWAVTLLSRTRYQLCLPALKTHMISLEKQCGKHSVESPFTFQRQLFKVFYCILLCVVLCVLLYLYALCFIYTISCVLLYIIM